MREIVANKDLTLSNIPKPDACWDEIGEFALNFGKRSANPSHRATTRLRSMYWGNSALSCSGVLAAGSRSNKARRYQ